MKCLAQISQCPVLETFLPGKPHAYSTLFLLARFWEDQIARVPHICVLRLCPPDAPSECFMLSCSSSANCYLALWLLLCLLCLSLKPWHSGYLLTIILRWLWAVGFWLDRDHILFTCASACQSHAQRGIWERVVKAKWRENGQRVRLPISFCYWQTRLERPGGMITAILGELCGAPKFPDNPSGQFSRHLELTELSHLSSWAIIQVQNISDL